MTQGQGLVKRLPENEPSSRLFQPAFSEEAEGPEENLRFGAWKTGESTKKNNLKHRDDGEV